MPDDFAAQLSPQRMAWQDAQVAADVGDDGAYRPAADPGFDLLRRGQVREIWVGHIGALAYGRPGGTRTAGDGAPRGFGPASRRTALLSTLLRARGRGAGHG